MKQFSGFPARMDFTSIPNLFFSSLLPQIDDIAELKTILHIIAALYRKRGHPRFLTYGELLGNASLMSSLKALAESPEEALQKALNSATGRGVIIHMNLDKAGVAENIYFLNTESNRRIVEKIKRGEYELSGLKAGEQAYPETEEMPDIFTLYEQNIGMLTPMIAEELLDAEKAYPESWIRDAIKEAINQNKRKWSYISAILGRWSAEGRGDGAYRQDSKKDPDKYIKGKYGHMVRR